MTGMERTRRNKRIAMKAMMLRCRKQEPTLCDASRCEPVDHDVGDSVWKRRWLTGAILVVIWGGCMR